MKAARVTSWGMPPVFLDVPAIRPPTAGELQLKMVAVGIPNVVRMRAAHAHPSSFAGELPYDPTIDGVGLDEQTGDLYYVPPLSGASLTERVNAEVSKLCKLPPGTDAVAVAGLANPTMSSWLALTCRATGGCRGRTVVIVGATSASGRCAALVARRLGAARIVGISRTAETLTAVAGLDERVLLKDPMELPTDLGPVHVVLDWVGGPAAVQLLQSAQTEPGQNLEYVRCGGLAKDMVMHVPMQLLNLRPIRVMASGMGSISAQEFGREAPELARMLATMQSPLEVVARSMADVEEVWESAEAKQKRLVLVP